MHMDKLMITLFMHSTVSVLYQAAFSSQSPPNKVAFWWGGKRRLHPSRSGGVLSFYPSVYSAQRQVGIGQMLFEMC